MGDRYGEVNSKLGESLSDQAKKNIGKYTYLAIAVAAVLGFIAGAIIF